MMRRAEAHRTGTASIDCAVQLVVLHSSSWASGYLRDSAIPAARLIATTLLIYWLWQEARVRGCALSDLLCCYVRLVCACMYVLLTRDPSAACRRRWHQVGGSFRNPP
jgi:hypothetical protein